MTMQIIKWNPMREVAHMHDDIMREWLGAARARPAERWTPPLDVIESEECITLHMDLPGVALEDVTVELHEGVLAISGERKRPDAGGSWQRVERSFGPFARQVRLPEHIATDGIRATMDRGVLTVEIPRAARAKPTRIEVTPVIEQTGEDQ